MLKQCLYLLILGGIIMPSYALQKETTLSENTNEDVTIPKSDLQEKLEAQRDKEQQLVNLLINFFSDNTSESENRQLVDLVEYYFSTDFIEAADISGFDLQRLKTQEGRGEQMEVKLVRCLRKDFLDDNAKTGMILAILNLIKKGCYFPATFEENEWLIKAMHVELENLMQEPDIKKYMELRDWRVLEVLHPHLMKLHSYREIAERTHL